MQSKAICIKAPLALFFAGQGQYQTAPLSFDQQRSHQCKRRQNWFKSVKMAMLMELPTQFLRSIMNYFWDFSEGDKRVADWFLMGDVIPTTYICLFYIAFCIITPKILKVGDKRSNFNTLDCKNVTNLYRISSKKMDLAFTNPEPLLGFYNSRSYL